MISHAAVDFLQSIFLLKVLAITCFLRSNERHCLTSQKTAAKETNGGSVGPLLFFAVTSGGFRKLPIALSV